MNMVCSKIKKVEREGWESQRVMSRWSEHQGTPSLDFALGKQDGSWTAGPSQSAQISITENTWESQEVFVRLLIQNHPRVFVFFFFSQFYLFRASLVAQMVKSSPAVQETQVQSQGQEDLLEKGMATDSSILAWKIHGQRSLAQVVGIKSFLGF